MGEPRLNVLGWLGREDGARRWRRALETPDAISASSLAEMSRTLRAERDTMDNLATQARRELLRRVVHDEGIERPDQCDWAMRAAPWYEEMRPRGLVAVDSPTPLPGDMKLFHDAAHADFSLRQDPAPDWVEGALFGLVLEVYRFDGSFVSFVQDLPQDAVNGLSRNHFVSVEIRIEREQPVEIYARLNVKNGPNTESMVTKMDIRGGKGRADFDLAYSKINEKRMEKAWLDLIIEWPEMTRIAIWDMVMLRAPRADF